MRVCVSVRIRERMCLREYVMRVFEGMYIVPARVTLMAEFDRNFETEKIERRCQANA